jgi:formiminotetrahydrofolate cyclodeaminase
VALLLVGEADALRARFVAARSADEAAYAEVPRAQALPRTTPAEQALRGARLQSALAGAAEAPLHAATLAVELLTLCERAAALHNDHLMSDVECALAFGEAAFTACTANVRINHRFLRDAHLVQTQARQLDELAELAQRCARAARALIATHV